MLRPDKGLMRLCGSHAGKLVLRIAREAEALASLITARIRIAQVGATRIAAATA